MIFSYIYHTPDVCDNLLVTSDGAELTGIRFTKESDSGSMHHELPIFQETSRWLDVYFSGREPDFVPKFRIENATPFRNKVLEIVRTIPFGEVLTYGQIAERIAEECGIERMSAQAVGGAVGWNPICIIIPCHRVMGANGSLTGYGGGIENKKALLKLEGISWRS